jgi:hypothetical protein
MTAARTITAFNQLFRELRTTCDLSSLSLGGVNMWPVVRLAAFYQHEALIDQVQAPVRSAARRGSPITRVGSAAPQIISENLPDAALMGINKAVAVDVLALRTEREVNLPDETGSALGFSAGLLALTKSVGLSFANLTSFAPRLAPHLSERGWLYAARPRAVVSKPAEFLQWHGAIADICARFNKGAGGEILLASHVCAHAARLLALLAPSRALIDTFAPRLLFTNGAFGIEKMAMIAAARGRGILCIDHQHGMYGAGSETFLSPLGPLTASVDPTPDIAWVWSEWFGRNYAGDPRAMPRIVGGSLAGGFAASARATNDAVRKNSQKVILYLHQGLVSAYDPCAVPLLPASVLEAISRSPSEWKWLVRLHPRWAGMARHADAAAGAVLQTRVSRRISFAHPSQMTLSECFRASDAVLTGFSASACLANDFGLPVVIHHPVGRDLFSPAIGEGRIAYAQEPGEIVEALAKCEAPPPSEPFVCHDLDLSRKAIMELWQLSKARTS